MSLAGVKLPYNEAMTWLEYILKPGSTAVPDNVPSGFLYVMEMHGVKGDTKHIVTCWAIAEYGSEGLIIFMDWLKPIWDQEPEIKNA